MNPNDAKAEGSKQSPRGQVARGRGRRSHIGPRPKGYSRRSTSASSSTDDTETTPVAQRTCSKPLDQVHICSESESGFSTATDTTEPESAMAKATKRKKRRRKKTNLAYKRKRSIRNVGCLRIDDGAEDTDEEKSTDDGSEDTDEEKGTNEGNDSFDETSVLNLSDMETADLNEILEYSAATVEETSDVPTPADLNAASSEILQLSTTDSFVVSTTTKPYVAPTVSSVSDSGAHATFSESTVPATPTEPAATTATVSATPTEPAATTVDINATAPAATTKLGADTTSTTKEPVSAASTSNLSESTDTATVHDNSLALLRDMLKLLLPCEWTIDLLEDHIIRMFTTTKAKNPSILYSIFFDSKERSIGLFVHGIPVPRGHRVFESQIVPALNNLGSIADYIAGVVQKILLFKKCQGIKNYEESFWETSKNIHIDYTSSLESPCYRHTDCTVLLSDLRKYDSCFSCQSQINKFQREIDKREKGELDPSSINDKHLTKEGMKAKKNKFRMLYREEKQRADRLQKRVDTLLVKIDELMSDELSSILRSNQHKMTPLQKLFWEEQMKVLALDDKRGMRWHPMLIRLALHLHSLSDSAYQFINESKVFVLPSSRRLYDYSHFTEASEGCNAEVTQRIREAINKCGDEEHYSYVNLMFDEMHIRSGLVFSRSTGELIGYTELSGVEEELQKMQEELNGKTFKPRLAKKVLVFLAQGITSNVKDVVAVFSTDDLSAGQLFDRAWEVIYHLEEASVKVLTLTCDGASINRKFIAMHEPIDKTLGYCWCTINLAAGDSRPLFFILDPPHLLKTLRNAFANSFAHRKSRKLWKNGEFLTWKVIEALFEATKMSKFRGHKLTKAHVKLTSFSVMTVLFATQTCSNSVAKCIEELKDHELLRHLDTTEVVKFIRLINKFFDCVNGKDDGMEKTNPDKAPFTDPDDARLHFLENDFLGYFEEWKRDVLNRPGIFSDTERSSMIVTHQTLGALQITVKGIAGAIRYMLCQANAPSVGARVFNQDPLEQYFSIIRRKQGDNRNPTLKGVKDTVRHIQVRGNLDLPSRKGNTEAEKRKDIQVDETPLPSRKVPRKN